VSVSLFQTRASIVGQSHCLTGADRSPFVIDGRTPTAAAETGAAVIAWGGGTAMHLGAPPRDAVGVSTGRLSRVVEHEPGDLTACLIKALADGRMPLTDSVVLHIVELLDRAYQAAGRRDGT